VGEDLNTYMQMKPTTSPPRLPRPTKEEMEKETKDIESTNLMSHFSTQDNKTDD